jgi:hypothetical protein
MRQHGTVAALSVGELPGAVLAQCREKIFCRIVRRCYSPTTIKLYYSRPFSTLFALKCP